MTAEYPTEEELGQIAAWSYDDFDGWMRHIKSIWYYGDSYFTEESPGKWVIHTVGWSGNESIIAAMRKNTIMWMVHWWSHRRGGHFELRSREYTDD